MTDFPSSPVSGPSRERLIAKMRAPKSNWDSIGLSRSERELIVAALRKSDHAQSPGWQPIETAPRDGTRILATGGGLDSAIEIVDYNVNVGAWNAPNDTLDDQDNEPEGYNRPTLWQPLPALSDTSTDRALLPRKLTAENGAKAALIGEFHEDFGILDKNGDERYIKVAVTWDTIKRIWDAAVRHFEGPESSPVRDKGDK